MDKALSPKIAKSAWVQSSIAADWSELPCELLNLIVNKLKILDDRIRFRAVCINWKKSTPEVPTNIPCQLPWLMIPQCESHKQPHQRSFFSLCDNNFLSLNLPEASQPYYHRGSSHGWLAVLQESPSIFLLNPVSQSIVNLPPLTSFPHVLSFNNEDVGCEYTCITPDDEVNTCSLKFMCDFTIQKVVLSESPFNESNYIAVAILHSGDLFYCKKGDCCWKPIAETDDFCKDVIYFNGKFYALSKFGGIAVCEFDGASPRVSCIELCDVGIDNVQYLVGCRDELLLVTRYFLYSTEVPQHDTKYVTTEFQVFKLSLREPTWQRVYSLENQMLFVGQNSSLALTASDFPQCKGNQIYFTDDDSVWINDCFNGIHDVGVYNLEDGSIEALPCYPRNSSSCSCWLPPIWITPNPC